MIDVITDEELEALIKKSKIPVLVEFWASWTLPCKDMSPIMDEIIKEYKDKIKVVRVDIENNIVSAGKHSVRAVPTILIFRNGKLDSNIIGVTSKVDIETFFKQPDTKD